MKGVFLIILHFTSYQLFSQTGTAGMQDEFSRMAKLGRNQGAEGLQSYSANTVKGTRYLNETWSTGTVTTMEDNVMSNSLLLMFDKINHDLYFKSKNETQILLADKNQVKKFVINTDSYSATFVKGQQIPGAEPDKFYVLLTGDSSGYFLYKLIKTRFIKANKQDLDRIKKGDFDDEYRDEFSYYILLPHESVKQVKLNVKSILSVLPSNTKKIKMYTDQFDQYEMNERFITGLVEYLNKI